jgi:hypothetical protein
MLTRGVRMADALAMVAELTAPVPVEEPAKKPVRSTRKSPLKKDPVPPRNKTASSPRNSTPDPAMKSTPDLTPEPQVPDDVDTQAAALEILAAHPDISGSELGRRLGKTPRYGCTLKSRLAPSVPGGDG